MRAVWVGFDPNKLLVSVSAVISVVLVLVALLAPLVDDDEVY